MKTTNNLSLILNAARYAPSADNTQPWKFYWHNSVLSVFYDVARVGDKTFPASNPATVLSMGALLENICQVADALDCKIDVEIPESIDKNYPLFFKIKIYDAEKECVCNNGLPLFKRHTNRFPFRKDAALFEITNVLKNMTLGRSRLTVLNHIQEIEEVSVMVKKASQVRFQTQELHEWLSKSIVFEKNVNDGLDVDTFDLPPGGKGFLRLISSWSRMEFLNKFHIYKVLAMIDAGPIVDAPALIAVTSPNGFEDLLCAGRLMNRAWIELNSRGVSVQPYFVIADQLHRLSSKKIPAGLEKNIMDLLPKTENIFKFQSGESLQMLFRVGMPTRSPVPSKRIPLEDILFYGEVPAVD